MKKIMFVVYMICVSVIITPTAHAYLDPATTSYIIQIGAGVVIALGTALGIYWKKIKGFFAKKNAKEEPVKEIKKPDAIDSEKSIVTADDLLDD